MTDSKYTYEQNMAFREAREDMPVEFDQLSTKDLIVVTKILHKQNIERWEAVLARAKNKAAKFKQLMKGIKHDV